MLQDARLHAHTTAIRRRRVLSPVAAHFLFFLKSGASGFQRAPVLSTPRSRAIPGAGFVLAVDLLPSGRRRAGPPGQSVAGRGSRPGSRGRLRLGGALPRAQPLGRAVAALDPRRPGARQTPVQRR
jgi:hypothetical protein